MWNENKLNKTTIKLKWNRYFNNNTSTNKIQTGIQIQIDNNIYNDDIKWNETWNKNKIK